MAADELLGMRGQTYATSCAAWNDPPHTTGAHTGRWFRRNTSNHTKWPAIPQDSHRIEYPFQVRTNTAPQNEAEVALLNKFVSMARNSGTLAALVWVENSNELLTKRAILIVDDLFLATSTRKRICAYWQTCDANIRPRIWDLWNAYLDGQYEKARKDEFIYRNRTSFNKFSMYST